MSDTESFESVARSYDDHKWILRRIAIDRLKAAHDREIRDTAQREYHRGYVDAMHARATETWQLDQERVEVVRGLREFRCEDIEPWFEMQFWTLLSLLGVESNASTPADCDDVAHLRDRLIHLLGGDSNSANSGGCSANNLQDSPNSINKNAETESYLMESADFNKLGERETVVRKLQALQFDGGSHENLSQIAYTIYPCATGWTCESAAGLRDKLIRLMGGTNGSQHMDRRSGVVMCDGAVSGRDGTGLRVSDAHRDSARSRLVPDDMNGVSDGRADAIGVTELVGHDDERGDDCDGSDSVGQTEVSDGRFADDSGSDAGGGYRSSDFHFDGVIYDELGNERQKAIANLRKLSERGNVWGRELIIALGLSINASNDDMCDRLIHLLGGDQPSGIDVMPTLSDLWGVWKDGDRTCPNDVPSSSITDELREWASDNTVKDMVLTTYPVQHGVHGILEQLIAIADRIDERAKHDRESDRLRIEKLVQQRDEFKRAAERGADLIESMAGDLNDTEAERDELRDERNELRTRLDGYESRDSAESIVRELTLGTITESDAIDRIEALHAEP